MMARLLKGDSSYSVTAKLIITNTTIYLFDVSLLKNGQMNMELKFALKVPDSFEPVISNFGKYKEVLAFKLKNIVNFKYSKNELQTNKIFLKFPNRGGYL